jgi:hypothetical protein
MQRIRNIFFGRSEQLQLLRCWKTQHPSSNTRGDKTRECDIRENFPSLFRVTTKALKQSTPLNNGRFFFTLDRIVEAMALFMLQLPSKVEMQEYCAELWNYAHAFCPGVVLHSLRFEELAWTIKRLTDGVWEQRLGYGVLVRLSPVDFSENGAFHAAIVSTRDLVRCVFRTILEAHWGDLHDALTFSQYIHFTRGFRHGAIDFVGMPVKILGIADLRPGPEDNAILRFCELAMGPAEVDECPICFVEMNTVNVLAPVVSTKCGHAFHQICLSKWTRSKQDMAHSCVLCRTPLSG